MPVRLDQKSYGLPAISSVVGRASTAKMTRVAQILAAAKTSRNVDIYLNYDTGFAGVYQATNTEPQAAVLRMSQGWNWVDYGAWPFGTWKKPLSSNRYSQGFGAFVAVATGFGAHTIPIVTTTTLQANPPNPLSILSSVGRDYAVGVDAYDFLLTDWTWGGLARSEGYPYQFGLPTALTGATSYFKPMPGAPAVHLGGGINVYSAFAYRVAGSWYFSAQAGVNPTNYAAFILKTLGVPVPDVGSQQKGPGGGTTTVSCAQTNKPTLSSGMSGSYVRLAQQRLNAWGAKLTVDGKFGPKTHTAVLKLQKAHDHQYYGGKIVDLTGKVGAGTWNLLCSSPGTKGSGSGGASPPSTGGTKACKGVFATVSAKTGLTCTESEILGLGVVGTLVLLLARR